MRPINLKDIVEMDLPSEEKAIRVLAFCHGTQRAAGLVSAVDGEGTHCVYLIGPNTTVQVAAAQAIHQAALILSQDPDFQDLSDRLLDMGDELIARAELAENPRKH